MLEDALLSQILKAVKDKEYQQITSKIILNAQVVGKVRIH